MSKRQREGDEQHWHQCRCSAVWGCYVGSAVWAVYVDGTQVAEVVAARSPIERKEPKVSYAYDVTVRVRAATMIGTERAAELVRIALEPRDGAWRDVGLSTAEIIGSAGAGEDAGTVGLSNKRLEDASGGAS